MSQGRDELDYSGSESHGPSSDFVEDDIGIPELAKMIELAGEDEQEKRAKDRQINNQRLQKNSRQRLRTAAVHNGMNELRALVQTPGSDTLTRAGCLQAAVKKIRSLEDTRSQARMSQAMKELKNAEPSLFGQHLTDSEAIMIAARYIRELQQINNARVTEGGGGTKKGQTQKTPQKTRPRHKGGRRKRTHSHDHHASTGPQSHKETEAPTTTTMIE